MMPDEKTMRQAFHELRCRLNDIRSKSAPLRAERDRIEAEMRNAIAAIDARVRIIEAPLPPMKKELAMISRALGGKTSFEGDT